MFRKILATLLCVVLLFLLCACGDNVQPGTPDNPDVPDTPDEIVFELERQLYAVDTDGNNLRRVVDKSVRQVNLKSVTQVWQHDNDVVYKSDDKTWYLDLSSGKENVLSGFSAYDFRIGENYIVFSETASFNALPILEAFDKHTGKTESLLGEKECSFNYCLFGDKLIYSSYYEDGDRYVPYYACIDLTTREKLWTVTETIDSLTTALGRIFCFVRTQDEAKLMLVDAQTGALTDSDIIFSGSVLYGSDTEMWVESYDGSFNLYRVNEERTEKFISDSNGYVVTGEVDGNFLLVSTNYTYEDTPDGDSIYYRTDNRKIVRKDGTVIDLAPRGEASLLFADCSFPLMDSSTARKPVTHDIFSYFCRELGADGAFPLCSTTHNAWLNIADGKADIALLAAPTEEEKAYLDSRGLSVDMKLYGGDGLVFIGNKDCGVENLTLEQVRDIYSGKITNWSELGGVDHEITVLYRDDQSGSQRLFEKLLFAGMELPDLAALGFEQLNEMSTLVTAIINDPYAIGYSIMTYLNDTYKYAELLAFSLDGVAPSPETVKDASYPLHTQGYAVIRSDKAADSPARRLYNWIGTPVCDTILYNNGVTPLSE